MLSHKFLRYRAVRTPDHLPLRVLSQVRYEIPDWGEEPPPPVRSAIRIAWGLSPPAHLEGWIRRPFFLLGGGGTPS